MFAVLYQGRIKDGTEAEYRAAWRIIAEYFINHCGALGSCLHKADDDSWIAYSRWPNRATRDAAWAPKEIQKVHTIPKEINIAVKTLLDCFENGYTETTMDVVDDLL